MSLTTLWKELNSCKEEAHSHQWEEEHPVGASEVEAQRTLALIREIQAETKEASVQPKDQEATCTKDQVYRIKDNLT